jgi:amidohydrolase
MDSEPVVVDFDAPTTCAAPVNINPAVYALKDELVSNRRWFHAHPELSFKEYETVAKIAEILRGYGLTEVFEGCGKTGLVGLIRGEAGPGPCVALRADCDGLPVTETAGIAYKSQNVGVMHACGHDGHMSELLAVAKILFAQKSRLKGVIKLVFQPAEEGYGGAPAMIKDGVLEDGPFGPRVDIIYGIHIWSENPVGVVQASNGPVMAASDRFDITVNGKGGHGAAPQHSGMHTCITCIHAYVHTCILAYLHTCIHA